MVTTPGISVFTFFLCTITSIEHSDPVEIIFCARLHFTPCFLAHKSCKLCSVAHCRHATEHTEPVIVLGYMYFCVTEPMEPVIVLGYTENRAQ